MLKKKIFVLVFLFIANILFATEVSRDTLGKCLIIPNDFDFVKYISELDRISNTIILSFPSKNIELGINCPFKNATSSIKIFSNTISFGIAKKINQNLRIGAGFESSNTKDEEKLEKDKQQYQTKKNQIAKYAIQLGTSWALSSENIILLGFKEKIHFCEESESIENLLITSKKFQTALEGISLNLCCLTKKYGIEFNLNTFNNSKFLNTEQQQQQKKLTYTGFSWEISPTLIKQVNENILLIVNPGIGEKQQKVEANENNMEKIQKYYFKNTYQDYFKKILDNLGFPEIASEPDYYVLDSKKNVITISKKFLPIIRIGMEVKINPNIKIRLGAQTKSTIISAIEEKIRITSPFKETVTKKYNELTKEANIGLSYSYNKFTIDLNINEMFSKEKTNTLYENLCFSYKF